MKKYALIQADDTDSQFQPFIQAPNEWAAFSKAAKHLDMSAVVLKDSCILQEITAIETI